MSSEDIIFYSLCYVGFGEECQRVVMKTSVDHFKAHYGPEPWSVKDLMSDLCYEFPELYDIELVLAGRWNYDESVWTNVMKLPVELSPSEKD